MESEKAIAVFESKQIRRFYDAVIEVWYFSLVDMVAALMDLASATDYLKKLRKRNNELDNYIGTNCPQVEMVALSGVKRKTLEGTAQQIFRIVQSIHSPIINKLF